MLRSSNVHYILSPAEEARWETDGAFRNRLFHLLSDKARLWDRPRVIIWDGAGRTVHSWDVEPETPTARRTGDAGGSRPGRRDERGRIHHRDLSADEEGLWLLSTTGAETFRRELRRRLNDEAAAAGCDSVVLWSKDGSRIEMWDVPRGR